MYTDFFHLNEEPFQVTPNPKYLFLSNVHRDAIQKLTDGVHRRKGFIEMVGIIVSFNTEVGYTYP